MLPQGADGEVDDGAHCPVPDGPAGATAKAWSEWLSSTAPVQRRSFTSSAHIRTLDIGSTT